MGGNKLRFFPCGSGENLVYFGEGRQERERMHYKQSQVCYDTCEDDCVSVGSVEPNTCYGETE